jgi:hypothetical protein
MTEVVTEYPLRMIAEQIQDKGLIVWVRPGTNVVRGDTEHSTTAVFDHCS